MDKFYITTSIAYTNAPPHIGFALELIQADVLARYNREQKKEVYFLTGTDEHGTKVENSAKEACLHPQKFVDQISLKFEQLTKILNISNTDFIRTTDKKRHIPAVQKVWQTLKSNGDIYKRIYKGLYCPGCEAFLTKKELADGKCPHHKIEPQLVEEENYFFKLSKYQKQLEEIIESNQVEIVPEERKNEILSFIKEGLEDVSFSRSKEKLKWGIGVPDDPNQVIYVWCDALTNYISALDFAKSSEKFKKFWPADVHLIGKDILRFHAIYWPAILLSLNLPLPKTILVHGFITVDGQKMSKSLGNVVDPFELVEKYGQDAVRYYLLREIPTTKDGDFSYQKFERRYNDDLAKGLGNLIARIKGLRQKIQNEKLKPKVEDERFIELIRKKEAEYKEVIENYRLNAALKIIWELISFCDKYIEEKRLWEESEKKKKDVENIVTTLNEITHLLRPFLPQTSEKILNQLKEPNQKEVLFPKL